jgi:hypothetical protein
MLKHSKNMKNELSIRHQMQIARRKNTVKVKPNCKIYNRKNLKID